MASYTEPFKMAIIRKVSKKVITLFLDSQTPKLHTVIIANTVHYVYVCMHVCACMYFIVALLIKVRNQKPTAIVGMPPT